MEVHSRIEHGQGNNNMAYSQRNQNHRASHNQTPHNTSDIYKPARSPSSRYAYTPQNQNQNSQAPPPPLQNINQVLHQRYPPTQQSATMPTIPNPLLYRDYRQNRISLLHSEYGPGRQREPLQSVVIEDGQPIKKIRLSDKDVPPLRIETREQPGSYNPQVEQISPTIPDHVQQEEAFRATKDELIQQIGKVDREIAKAESSIAILKKKQAELEEIANKPAVKAEIVEDQPKHQSLHQKIYAENRKRAQTAHGMLDVLGPKVDWPLYNQPSDTSVYHENKRKHLAFKGKLIEYFKRRHAEKELRNSYLTETYSKLMQEWLRKVDKIEGSTKRRTKDTKNREFFEKVFPEMRKQREDKERFNRIGSRVKSEADLEEIMDNLQEQAMEDKKMRSYAVIPPILLNPKEKRIKYDNNNGHVEDMETVYKNRKFLNVWTPAEKDIFKEKYLQHPKNFHVIASYLDRKSVADCVQYYYLSKKTENYKQLLRKSRQRTRSSRQNTTKANNPANTSVVDILTTGVTTRLQREQQAKTVVNRTSQSTTESTTEPSRSTTPVTSTATSTTTTSNNTTTTTTTATTIGATSPTTNSTTETTATIVTSTITTATVTPTTVTTTVNSVTPVTTDNVSAIVTSSGTSTVNTIPIATVAKVENNGSEEHFNDFNSFEDYRNKKFFVDDGKEKIGMEGGEEKKEVDSATDATSDQNMANAVSENKKKTTRRKEENLAMETSDEEVNANQDKQQQGTCAVCHTQLNPQHQSRPLQPTQAAQYNLHEDQLPPNARVCNTCRCKSVRSRYTHCPLPNCPNSRTRVKRLRSIPADLNAEGVTKCCSACFIRVQRRLVEGWSGEEVEGLRGALRELGGNWQAIGERLGKVPSQVKSFYAVNRKRLGLEGCLGEERKPALTDEEESGSSTSSCEEEEVLRGGGSDTASAAESPPVLPGNRQSSQKKEDYDSSATETADEAVTTPDNYQGSATITPVTVTIDSQQQQNQSPLSVKDLVLNVIELQLMKNSGGQPQQQQQQQAQTTPTSSSSVSISSILNSTNDSGDVTIVSEYNLPPQQKRNDLNLAKLVTPLIGATITPVTGPIQNQPPEPQPPSRDDLVQIVQVNHPETTETLDLSIKKPRDPIQLNKSQHRLLQADQQYIYHQDRIRTKLPSPKPANPKTGSITLGTPIITQPRYGLLRHMAPENAKMGSITQGTPIHMPHNSIQEKQRVFDYYNNKRQPPQQQQQPQQQYPGQQQQQYREPGYTVDQHMSSRQIIMNDYITSQQMLGRRRDEKMYVQRQGVIQRHTRPQYLQGCEALSSLVDVAVQQPNLPVPSAPHEGLGKTIAEQLEQPHRYQLFNQQQQQQQQIRQQQQQFHRQQQQQSRQPSSARTEPNTLTAASLIDAIITHQINQTVDGNRGEIVSTREQPTRAGDLLFQGFQQPDEARPPSVISVDTDPEPVNKNLTVKELTDSVISHDFSTRQATTSSTYMPPNNERQIIRIAQQQPPPQPPTKYHVVEPVSPPDNNHWNDSAHFRRYASPQAALDYVKNRIVEVMRTEDDKKEGEAPQDRDSPGDMVIDEEPQQYTYSYGGTPRSNEPKPLLCAQYEPLSDED